MDVDQISRGGASLQASVKSFKINTKFKKAVTLVKFEQH